MSFLAPVLDQIGKLWARVDRMPVVRWATVVQVSPLRVLLDGDLEVLPFAPASTVHGLPLGARVVCVEQHRRVIVISAGGGVPVGTVHEFGGSALPPDHVWADGAALSRTDHAALFAVYGTTYGAGNGSTTFNVPNRNGRVGVGRAPGDAQFGALGQTSGSKTHALAQNELPGTVIVDVGANNADFGLKFSNAAAYTAKPMADMGSSGQPHNNIQPSIALNYIIKAA